MNTLNKTLIGTLIIVSVSSCSNNQNKQQTATTEKYIAFNVNQIDSTASPCEDFEEFAVGNWLKNNPVPASESRWGSFSIVHDANETKLRKIVENAEKENAKKNSPTQQVGDFYASALDSSKVNELGIKPIQPMLDKIDAVSNIQELVETMAATKKIGSGSIFSNYVEIDSKNSSQYIMYLSQGGIGLPDRDYYFPKSKRGKKILAAYKKHIAAHFVLAGNDSLNAKKMATKVVEIETDLAKNSMTRVERRDPLKTYNKMSINKFQKLCPIINWKSFFNAGDLTEEGVENLVITQPNFFKALNKTLKKYDLADWKAYMKFQLINDFARNLSIAFEQENFNFYSKTLRGVSVMKPRWKRALSKCNAYVGEQLGKLFVEKYFPESSKQKVLDLIGNINKAFKERVQKLDWMSDSTKTKTLEKLRKYTYKIGYPDKWKDYTDVDISANNLIQNIFNANKHHYLENIHKLGKPIDRTEWGMNPQRINAYYNPAMNEIVFPAAILQPPFFSPKADDAINYGGIGSVIGHEFSHGFDDQGSKYDGDGNLHNWWSKEDSANFSNRTAKLANQFDAYEVVEGNHVNGHLTMGENIADLSGITLAYYALQKAMEGKKDPMIDGFTYNQRFFLGWAQVWHTNINKAALINQIKTDPHSPTRYRTNGPLTNMNEFRKAFNCAKGDKMVAPDSLQVKIW